MLSDEMSKKECDQFDQFLKISKCFCDRYELKFNGYSEEKIIELLGTPNDDSVVCTILEPMKYLHSAFLYKRNIGKLICNNCECWAVYASHLSGCVCMCHNSNVWASR